MLTGNSTGHGNSNNNGYQGNGNNNGHGSSFGNSDTNGYQRYQRRQFQRNQNQSHYTHGTHEQTHSIFADETPDDILAVTHINNTEHDHPDNKLHLYVTPQEATLETNTDTQPLDSLEQNPLPDGNEHIGTIFLDTGSNTSYISSSFAERLQLLPIDNQGPQLRRSTRLRMPTQFFSAITILALITGSSGFEICQCTKTPIPTTTDSSPTTFGYLHQWITIVLFLLMFFGIYGWINFILILQCLFTWIEKCIQCVFSIVRLGSKQCRQHHQISPTIIVLLCLIQGSYSCNEIASIQDDVCTASADGKTCHLNKVVSINIRPNSQVGCFTISNNVKEVKNIEVRANSIISECNERSHHFTRQMKINHFFSHRCAVPDMEHTVGNQCHYQQQYHSLRS
ncbi:hypothetical protein L3Y34_015766 [Caenorhabditis briggsae]|uniref:Phlebovirus glycoprotein G2 fusion domain-containing protein n=1 Tax=Caenorhabditis briggsae TaxID=6238 RepID=A0AAE9DVU8_CAEBR|nr:hypothetical protein L3Y34_015766 [Caenorhabditis briggsae]